MLQRETVKMNF